jgi:hypothetical protein
LKESLYQANGFIEIQNRHHYIITKADHWFCQIHSGLSHHGTVIGTIVLGISTVTPLFSTVVAFDKMWNIVGGCQTF